MKKNNDYDVEASTGNVFADLGLPDPEERLSKAKLAIQINKIIEKKRLTQRDAAELLGIDQPKISALRTGKLSGFSLERLFRFLNILDQDIIINITPKKRLRQKASVTVTLPRAKRTRVPRPSTSTHIPQVYARKKNK